MSSTVLRSASILILVVIQTRSGDSLSPCSSSSVTGAVVCPCCVYAASVTCGWDHPVPFIYPSLNQGQPGRYASKLQAASLCDCLEMRHRKKIKAESSHRAEVVSHRVSVFIARDTRGCGDDSAGRVLAGRARGPEFRSPAPRCGGTSRDVSTQRWTQGDR